MALINFMIFDNTLLIGIQYIPPTCVCIRWPACLEPTSWKSAEVNI